MPKDLREAERKWLWMLLELWVPSRFLALVSFRITGRATLILGVLRHADH